LFWSRSSVRWDWCWRRWEFTACSRCRWRGGRASLESASRSGQPGQRWSGTHLGDGGALTLATQPVASPPHALHAVTNGKNVFADVSVSYSAPSPPGTAHLEMKVFLEQVAASPAWTAVFSLSAGITSNSYAELVFYDGDPGFARASIVDREPDAGARTASFLEQVKKGEWLSFVIDVDFAAAHRVIAVKDGSGRLLLAESPIFVAPTNKLALEVGAIGVDGQTSLYLDDVVFDWR